MDRWQFEKMKVATREDFLLFALLVLLICWVSGCSTMGHERVEGWPELQIVEHYVSHAEMRDRCQLYVSFGSAPEACAEFSFSTLRCDIWYSADFPPASYVVAHERQHCLGYAHVGDDSMKQMLATYRRQ